MLFILPQEPAVGARDLRPTENQANEFKKAMKEAFNCFSFFLSIETSNFVVTGTVPSLSGSIHYVFPAVFKIHWQNVLLY